MPFPRSRVVPAWLRPFNDTIGNPFPSVAEPSWFAPPIDMDEDDEAILLVFHVGRMPDSKLSVEAKGNTVFIWGELRRRRGAARAGHRARRIFALPFDVVPDSVETSRSEELLYVRVVKRRRRGSRDDSSKEDAA